MDVLLRVRVPFVNVPNVKDPLVNYFLLPFLLPASCSFLSVPCPDADMTARMMIEPFSRHLETAPRSLWTELRSLPEPFCIFFLC